MPPAAAASPSWAPPGRRLAASAARPAALPAPSRASAAASKRQPLSPATAFAAAARLPPPPAVGSCAVRRQSPALCRAGQQQPEFDFNTAAASGPQAGTDPAAADSWPAPAPPAQPQGLLNSVEAGIEAARTEVLKSMAELPQTARAAVQLLPQLHYPTPRFIARYTAQILLVVAAFLVYVVLVDRLCSTIPRFLVWTRLHPGWAPWTAAAAGPAAAAQLAALQQGGAQLAAQLAAAAAAAPGLLPAGLESIWALASSPDALQQAAAGWMAALWQASAGAAAVGQSLLAGLLAVAKRRLAGA